MAEAKSLDDLRREVDAIDDALHDLIMRRAGVTDAIARMKPRSEGRIPLALAMRPAREAEIMRRFIARHTGSPPLTTAIRVIREVLTASLMAQVPFKVHVFAGSPEFAEIAHAHFGAETPLLRYDSVVRMLNACSDDVDSLAVVPLPDGGDAWWTRLARPGRPGARVIAKLPFVQTGDKSVSAYALAAIEHESTGDDTTMLLAEVAPSLSRTGMISQFKDAGIDARVVGAGTAEKATFVPVLLEADGFVSADDPRLAAFSTQAGESADSIVPVGGFANPAVMTTQELAR